MRTDQEIVDETNELAHYLLRMKGYEAAEGALLYEAEDPRRAEAWLHAVHIMEMITKTEVQDALNNVLTEKVDPHPLDAMRRAESFISGFEDDDLQDGIAELLAGLRTAIAKVEDMWGLLCASLDAWDDEEDSVKVEHAELIADLSEFIGGIAQPAVGANATDDQRRRRTASDIMLAALKRIVAGREIKDPSDGADGSTIVVSLDLEEVEAICDEAIAKVEGR